MKTKINETKKKFVEDCNFKIQAGHYFWAHDSNTSVLLFF